ncbi:hypothetical protein FC24_GL000454 [Loigolactobacillus rennini DSM 20253]|uniref:Uncharacterized protein n=1 Tax=Loigolactobacillus rennini DSM 20253 TaxID=1423796 RepID=A0A0R2CPC1_9LACO|nr:hypothetical protein FC24_GL000454 [Loigolactobacillus rennini DSM 20253]
MQQKEAAESRRKATEAAAAVEKMKLQQYHEQTIDTETGEIVAAEPSLIETTLKISGTKEQLVALKKYMDETGIEYERLEV